MIRDQTRNRLKIVSEKVSPTNKYVKLVLCKCVCGKRKWFYKQNVVSGKTKSCGCLRRECSRDRLTKHGMTKSPEFKTWVKMRERCLNKNCKSYPDYGGRGIGICKRWDEFVNFYEDMGHRPKGMTIDRVNNNKGYCKQNCKWSSRREQANNTRRNVVIKYNGVSKTRSEWARDLGINESSLMGRIDKLGWSLERALTTRKCQ